MNGDKNKMEGKREKSGIARIFFCLERKHTRDGNKEKAIVDDYERKDEEEEEK